MVCPSQNQTLTVLRQMLSQVAEVHPRSKRVHIGSDEVYQDMIGKCRQCRERMASRYWGNSDLFLSHVVNVATLVRDELKLQPLMWDDEFRSIAESDLHRSGVGRLVDIVVWNYSPVLQLPAETWTKYLNVFNSIWVASAFKGATGSDQVVTDINYHMQNHMSWVTPYHPHSRQLILIATLSGDIGVAVPKQPIPAQVRRNHVDRLVALRSFCRAVRIDARQFPFIGLQFTVVAVRL